MPPASSGGIRGAGGGTPGAAVPPTTPPPPKLTPADEALIQATKPGESGTLSNGQTFTRKPDGTFDIDL